MDCQSVRELLPWLLNGTLAPEEEQRARRHLKSCPACRREVQEVRQAAAVFGAHIPSATLVELAWDRETAGVDPALLLRHLDSCEECTEELALARQSRRSEAEAQTPRALPTRPGFVRYAGLAASLALAFATGTLWRASRDAQQLAPVEAERRRLESRAADLEAEVQRAQQSAAQAEERARALSGPQPNLPIIELLPGDSVVRAGASAQPEVRVPAGATFVVLLLSSTTTSGGPAAVEVRDEHGTVVWRDPALEPSPLGGYTLGLPTALLPGGRGTLVLRPSGGRRAETYQLVLRREP